MAERTTGGPLPGMPFNDRAAEARSSIVEVLGAWAATVVDKRDVPGPQRSVAALAEFLIRHIAWLSTHDTAGDVSEEVAQLVRQASLIVDPEPSRRVPVGICVEEECVGELTAVVRPRQPQMPAAITCDVDPSHRWFGHEWLQLSRRLGTTRTFVTTNSDPADGAVGQTRTRVSEASEQTARQADTADKAAQWLSVDAISKLWAIHPGSVYRHASLENWRRRRHSGRTYYHASDVSVTLSKRATASEAH